MHTVTNKILKTDRFQVILGQHEDHFDEQKFFADTIKYYTVSTTSDIKARSILGYIVSAQFGVDQWKSDAVTFIFHWQEQVCLYNSLVDKELRFIETFTVHLSTPLVRLSLINAL